MSSTSVARKNRRMQKRSSPSLPPLRSDKQHIFSLNELNSKSESGAMHESDTTSDISTTGGKSELPKDASGAAYDQDEHLVTESGGTFINYNVSSSPLKKIFIEEERGFKVIDSCEIFQTSLDECHQQSCRNKFAIDVAYGTSIYFHSFSNFCHGLLGGISVLQCLLLYHLISSPFQEETLYHFSFLSQPVNNIFNFLCIICCLSAFDRHDIGNPRYLLKFSPRCKLRIIIVLIYPLCLLLSISTANVDDKLSLHGKNSSTWESVKIQDRDELFYWKTLSLTKSIGAVFGWILLAHDPNYNLFLTHLGDMTKK